MLGELHGQAGCPHGIAGHTWQVWVDAGSLNITPVEPCSSSCQAIISNDLVDGDLGLIKLQFWEEHPRVGGWHGDTPCDCNWGFRIERIPEGDEGGV